MGSDEEEWQYKASGDGVRNLKAAISWQLTAGALTLQQERHDGPVSACRLSSSRARHWSPVLSSWFAVLSAGSGLPCLNSLDWLLCTPLPGAVKQHCQHQLICLFCSLLLQNS